jgi:hypothetical protein
MSNNNVTDITIKVTFPMHVDGPFNPSHEAYYETAVTEFMRTALKSGFTRKDDRYRFVFGTPVVEVTLPENMPPFVEESPKVAEVVTPPPINKPAEVQQPPLKNGGLSAEFKFINGLMNGQTLAVPLGADGKPPVNVQPALGIMYDYDPTTGTYVYVD